jgi:hypothetical protein
MRALAYLLGARAIETAAASDRDRLPAEPPFLPLASTPDAASAWRRWAAEGRAAATAMETAASDRSGSQAGSLPTIGPLAPDGAA